MPVAEGLPDLTIHHGSTDKPYGCHNRAPYPAVSVAPNGTAWPFRMAPDCQFTKTDLGKADKRCDGCSWRGPVETTVAAGCR